MCVPRATDLSSTRLPFLNISEFLHSLKEIKLNSSQARVSFIEYFAS